MERERDQEREQQGIAPGEAEYYSDAGLRMMAQVAALKRDKHEGWGRG